MLKLLRMATRSRSLLEEIKPLRSLLAGPGVRSSASCQVPGAVSDSLIRRIQIPPDPATTSDETVNMGTTDFTSTAGKHAL